MATTGPPATRDASASRPRSGEATEHRQRHALVDPLERHLDRQPEPRAAGRRVGEEAREADARILLELDEGGDERHAPLITRKERAVNSHPGEDPAAAADRRPGVVAAPASG